MSSSSHELARRMSRFVGRFFIVTFLVVSAILLDAAPARGDGNPPKGAARRWEASMPVGTYGQVNLRTGRVLTTLPVVSWSGRGPSIDFALFHNMNSPQSDLVVLDQEQFSQNQMSSSSSGGGGGGAAAPDWRHSYSSSIHWTEYSNVVVTYDDGTEDEFTPYDYGEYEVICQPPPGVFGDVRYNYEGNYFTLTTKHQWKARYEDADPEDPYLAYRLAWVSDATRLPSPNNDEPANKVTCSYEENSASAAFGKLTKVTDASSRALHLYYSSTTGNLKEVQDALPTPRAWKLLYATSGSPSQDGTGAFVALDDAMNYRIHWTYDSLWNITDIADKDDHNYSIEYYYGWLETVHDPSPFTSTQMQVWNFHGEQDENEQLVAVVCEYRDRRENFWTTRFDAATGNLAQVTDPLEHSQNWSYEYGVDPYDPLAHEATSYTNPMNHTWDTGYDDHGNVIWTTDPLDDYWAFDYDSGGLNNLVAITDPEQHEYGFSYGAAVDPTALGSVTLPAGDTGGAGTIALGYDAWSSSNKAVGKMRQLTDAIGCDTYFNYDRYGQLQWTREGVPTWATGVEAWMDRNEAGFVSDTSNTACKNCIIVDEPGSNPETTICYPGHCRDPNLAGDAMAKCCCDCEFICVLCSDNVIPGCPNGWYWCRRPSGGSACSGSTAGSGEAVPEEENSITSYTPPKTCKKDFGPPPPPEGPSWFTYDAMRRPTSGTAAVDFLYGGSTNEYANFSVMHSYDSLGRLTSATRSTNELPYYGPEGSSASSPISRSFNYEHLMTEGIYHRTGPDGQITTVNFDEAGRPASIDRKLGTTTLLSGTVSAMYEDGLPDTIDFGNGTGVHYEFNLARQLQKIRHFNSSDATLLMLEYSYNDRGLITGITETVGTTQEAVTSLGYDGRGRLTSEHRAGTHGYFYLYTYDQGGNRQTKVEKNPDTEATLKTTVYHYDVEDPTTYGSWNNRLIYSELFDSSSTLLETNSYIYGSSDYNLASVRWQVRKPASSSNYYGTQMLYDETGNTRYFSQNQWQLSGGNCSSPTTEVVTEVRGAGRGRYMKRQRDPTSSGHGYVVAGSTTWSDYDGDTIYGDYVWNTSTSQVDNKVSYLPGIGQYDVSATTKLYYHGDQIGSTRLLTDGSGSVVGRFVYTAFGDKIYEDGGSENTNPPATRYQFGGTWGYETFSDLPYIHVGYRWYDPATGRFLQRDPIGIRGGLNVYSYCGYSPVMQIDPQGLDYWGDLLFGPISGDGALCDIMETTLPPIPGPSGAQIFIAASGGSGPTFLDRWGDRLAGRVGGIGAATGGGVVAAGRIPKGILIRGQARTTSLWRGIAVRAGRGVLGNGLALGGGVCAGISAFYDVYVIVEEGIYAGYGIPPGEY